MARKRRWPTPKEILENVERGIVDDRKIAVPSFDLEPWEVLGLPEPEEAPERPEAAEALPRKARKAKKR
ncbi:MAG: hypothetical protein HY690_13440 [Chloroflexi bacterium]|nr:hypothetical protein [Chloroflexota bacterium]